MSSRTFRSAPHLERGAGALQGRVSPSGGTGAQKIGLPVEHDMQESPPVWTRRRGVRDGLGRSDATLESHDARCCGGGAATRRHYDKWRCDGQMWTNDVDSRTRGGGSGRADGADGRGDGTRAGGERAGVSRRVVAGEIAGGARAEQKRERRARARGVNFAS